MKTQIDRQFLSSIILGIATPSVLISQKLGESLMTILEETGKASEEIFRGERLPLLNIAKKENFQRN